jgi:hypothetical protein
MKDFATVSGSQAMVAAGVHGGRISSSRSGDCTMPAASAVVWGKRVEKSLLLGSRMSRVGRGANFFNLLGFVRGAGTLQ